MEGEVVAADAAEAGAIEEPTGEEAAAVGSEGEGGTMMDLQEDATHQKDDPVARDVVVEVGVAGLVRPDTGLPQDEDIVPPPRAGALILRIDAVDPQERIKTAMPRLFDLLALEHRRGVMQSLGDVPEVTRVQDLLREEGVALPPAPVWKSTGARPKRNSSGRLLAPYKVVEPSHVVGVGTLILVILQSEVVMARVVLAVLPPILCLVPGLDLQHREKEGGHLLIHRLLGDDLLHPLALVLILVMVLKKEWTLM